MNRPENQDIELYVSGNFDGDVGALERAIAEDPAVAGIVADEARFEMLLRDAAAAAVFCVACEELVRGERCDACGAATRPGGYVVERVLVSNAHGRMYVARDADGKHVALKELAFVQAPSTSTIEAFEREAKFLRALEHPAIPRFVASFEEGRGVHTRYYLAQELVEGQPLDQIDDHWYSEAEIVDIARQVLSIIVYLQSLSPMVIHRDIKPANLVRRADGSIALVDFGAAYAHGATAGLTTVGTFGYMPVEQLAGIVDATTDCYALGASLLYLLTRQEPWRLQQTKTTVNACAPLRAFLDRLVANDPRERFASAKDALAALENRNALTQQRPGRAWSRVRPTRIAFVAMLAVVLGGAGVLSVHILTRTPSAVEPPVPVPGVATLRIAMTAGATAELYVDDRMIALVQHDFEIPVEPGARKVKLLGANGARCESEMKLAAGKTTTVECIVSPPVAVAIDAGIADRARAPHGPRLDITTPIDLSFTSTPFPAVVGVIARHCKLNVVVPSWFDFKVSTDIKGAPCNQAFETLLEAHELAYVYRPDTRIVRIVRLIDLDGERERASASGKVDHPRLPAGKPIDIEAKQESLRTVLKRVLDGSANLVLPEHFNDAKVSVLAKGVPSNEIFEVILESLELGYRYREQGNLVRVARQIDL